YFNRAGWKMSGGRVRPRGGRAWGKLPISIGIKSLGPYRTANATSMGYGELRCSHKKIRESFNIYRLAHGANTHKKSPHDIGYVPSSTDTHRKTYPVTKTKIQKSISKIQTLARRASRHDYDEEYLALLEDELHRPINMVESFYQELIQQGIDIYGLRANLFHQSITDNDRAMIKALGEGDFSAAIPNRSQPDPPLVQLVSELSPIWQEFTGASAYPRNNRNQNILKQGSKYSFFSDWISDQVRSMGLYPPPENRINKIVIKLHKIKK
ncbi:MAG: hypothetical protein OQK24_12945, partial [Magnetovibrio sp.]|nr:hypothetical protein [Magnetovibrio sp.]